MQKIDSIHGRAIPLLLDDIDTDRIIPARYLRCVTFDGIGQYAFEDDRKQDPQHPFNDDRFQGASILISGRNFGCGSSREHAPQSLMRWGIKGIVAESYAEIFFGNCNSLGIPAVRASRADLEKLAAAVRAEPNTECVLDLNSLTLKCGALTVPVEMPAAVKESLVTGQWDFLGQLLERESDVEKTAKTIPYMQFAK
jgi:3-isopropylmalate/(R)-2-methylmalate dehydratase small subunit